MLLALMTMSWKSSSWKISRYSSSLVIMMASKWPCLLSEKTPPSSFMRFCLSLRSTMEPSLTPMRMGIFLALQAWMTSLTWARSLMLPGFRRILWTPASIASRARWKWKCTSATIGTVTCGRISFSACVSFFSGTATRTRSAPGGGELVDLGDARVDVVGVAGGHRLHRHRRVAADADEAVGLVTDHYLARLAARGHRPISKWGLIGPRYAFCCRRGFQSDHAGSFGPGSILDPRTPDGAWNRFPTCFRPHGRPAFAKQAKPLRMHRPSRSGGTKILRAAQDRTSAEPAQDHTTGQGRQGSGRC